MQITRAAKPLENNIKIWPCEGCGGVHLKVRDSLVDLSKDDLASFTEAVVELYCKSQLSLGNPSIEDCLTFGHRLGKPFVRDRTKRFYSACLCYQFDDRFSAPAKTLISQFRETISGNHLVPRIDYIPNECFRGNVPGFSFANR